MASFSTPERRSCTSAGRITAKLLLSFLALSPVAAAPDPLPPLQLPIVPGDISTPGPVIGGGNGHSGGVIEGEHTFTLRHILHHGTYQYPQLLRRMDIHQNTLVVTEDDPVVQARPSFSASSRAHPIQRLADRSVDTMENYLFSYRAGIPTTFAADAWTTDVIPQPNVTDKTTLLTLARIAANAYIQSGGTEDWVDVGHPYNVTDDFGWEGDGLRGHIFADENNKTVIIGLKGTSPAVFDGAETTTNDKVNDNLLFSCCCARVSYWWKTVCDCFSGTAFTCDTICLKNSLSAENRYYRASLNLYYNVTAVYPDAQIWVVGHSLGGAISSLLGQTYGLPVVTFEAPGDAMAAERLGLPSPHGEAKQSPEIGVFHFGHTADPIYMGTCNGPTSVCSIGGYAMESRCHTGMECVYDVVSDRGWRMGLGYHRIQTVIKDVIEKYEEVPVCSYEPGCMDCFNWNFVKGNETHTTTKTAEPTSTSTTTCKTPGWWGCLDKTTTTTTSTSSVTTSVPVTTTAPPETTATATTTCTHRGMFGNCLDPSPVPTGTTETCSHYNFWGNCADAPPMTATSTSTTEVLEPTSTSPETCSHYNFWGNCADAPPTTATLTTSTTEVLEPTSTLSITPAPEPTSKTPGKDEDCLTPGRIWGCWDNPTSTTSTSTSTSLCTEFPKHSNVPGDGSGEWKCLRRALGGWGWCIEWGRAVKIEL
ncbi:putative lipase atg15 [Rhizina undulata]